MKEKIKNGFEKVKTAVKEHKSKLIKGGAIVGGSALGLGILGAVMHNRFNDDGYYEEEFFEEVEIDEPFDSPETEESDED